MEQSGIEVILDAPAVVVSDVPRLAFMPDKRWGIEREAFFRMLPDLLVAYRGRYVSIYNGSVVAEGDDFISVASDVYARLGRVPAYVGLVADPPTRVARAPSPRTATR